MANDVVATSSTSRTITRLLVANRGEIARRVFRTCRDLGIGTVAVHSAADAALSFVREADVAARLPGNTPAETYLRGDLVVQAAVDTGADAVHPGYGFLSESAGFARQVIEAGLTWLGPTPASIEQMASKVAAKKLMADAGVPVLSEIDPVAVTEADLPLLVKVSAGGGGRGMRVVRTLAGVTRAVQQASAEAASAFGDATVFCEPYVERGRHVEVQVLGDTHDTVVVLGDRDCSVQRRHQKVVEEAPAPNLADDVRTSMHRAARTAAGAIGYVGAGTVEFLVDGSRFFFLEMNTRLQVEHPVTELVTGLDLVEQQIRVAEGERLVCGADGVPREAIADEPRGHAVEVRLYAEDPAHDWQPQSGLITRFDIPATAEFEPPASYGVRLDAGFGAGDLVGTHYDAMLAKVVAWGPSRDVAIRRLAGALERAQIHGIRTNRDLLVEVLRHRAFVEEQLSTDFLTRHDLASLSPRPVDADALRVSAFAAAVALAERARSARDVQHGVPSGWRNVVSQPQQTRFVCDDVAADPTATADESGVVVARWYGGRDGYRSADGTLSGEPSTGAVTVRDGETTRRVEVYVAGDRVDVESSWGHVTLVRVPRFVDPADQVANGSLIAPMPGSVVRIDVERGQGVTAGQPVLVLEAMKMQHTVTAPHGGEVADLPVEVGSHVAAGAVLAVVRPATTDEGEDA